MEYWEWLAKLKQEYLNKYVWYEGRVYKVVEIGEHGQLYIDRPTDCSETTEVRASQVLVRQKYEG